MQSRATDFHEPLATFPEAASGYPPGYNTATAFEPLFSEGQPSFTCIKLRAPKALPGQQQQAIHP